MTLARSTAQIQAGASERSRKLRNELRGGLEGLSLDGAELLLERLLQVRAEDYDARSGWRSFDDARRRLRRAESIGLGERREAALAVVERGLDLFGAPIDNETGDQLNSQVVVSPAVLQLVAYESLVEAETAPPAASRPEPLFT